MHINRPNNDDVLFYDIVPLRKIITVTFHIVVSFMETSLSIHKLNAQQRIVSGTIEYAEFVIAHTAVIYSQARVSLTCRVLYNTMHIEGDLTCVYSWMGIQSKSYISHPGFVSHDLYLANMQLGYT